MVFVLWHGCGCGTRFAAPASRKQEECMPGWNIPSMLLCVGFFCFNCIYCVCKREYIFQYFSFELPVCLSVCGQHTLLSWSSDLPVVSVPNTQYFLLLQVLNIVHNMNLSPAAQLSESRLKPRWHQMCFESVIIADAGESHCYLWKTTY